MPQLGEIKKARELNKVGTLRYIWLACPDCKKERWTQLYKGIPTSELCKRCCKRGKRSKAWKGGKHTVASGYIKVWIDPQDPFYKMADSGGYVFEHRLVIAKHLGRCLELSELVHHLNGIKTDNRLKNLVILGNSSHNHYLTVKDVQQRLREVEEELAQQRLL